MTFQIDDHDFPELPVTKEVWFTAGDWSFDDEDVDLQYCESAIAAWVAWWRYVKEAKSDEL